jgi:preprotein translocase subunit SecG
VLEQFQTFLIVVHVLVCALLITVVLLQPGKSGGIAALGSAGVQQLFGGRGAGNVLTRVTWICLTTFFLTSVTLAYLSSSTGDSLQNLEEPAE